MFIGIMRVILLVCFASFLCACNSDEQQGRAFLIGVDGATWDVIMPLVEHGELPNIKRLMDEGAYGQLATDIAESPVSWTSIITGKSRDKHGVNETLGEEGIWADTIDLKTNRLWDILLYYHKRVGVYCWYLTQPCKEIPGFWIPMRKAAYPVSDELQSQLNHANRTHVDELLFLIDTYECDVITAFWHNVDTIQHAYWLYHVLKQQQVYDALPADMQQEATDKAEQIYESYRAFDVKLGNLSKRITHNDALIIVSDHGFSLDLHKTVKIRKYFWTLGLQAGWLKPMQSLEQISADGALQGISFTVSKEFLPSYASSIFTVDSLQCYQENMVEPVIVIHFDEQQVLKHEYEYVKTELKNSIIAMTERGVSVFRLQKEEQQEMRFVLSESSRMYCTQLTYNQTSAFLDVTVRTGGHTSSDGGIILLWGNRFKKNYQIQNAHLYDVVPTILASMNLPVGKDMDGKILRAAMEYSMFKRFHYIDSYDDIIPVQHITGERNVALSEERRRYLQSLGYIQ